MKTRCSVALVFTVLLLARAVVAEDGSSVLVVYNTKVSASKEVAEHYAAARAVPESQVLGFALPEGETMTRTEFRYDLQEPLFERLTKEGIFKTRLDTSSGRLAYVVSESKIRYLVLCYGVPVRIQTESILNDPGAEVVSEVLRGRNEAAVDSELVWLPIMEKRPTLAGPMDNEFRGQTNASAFHPTNGILMTARLDGPSPEIAKALVDRAMNAESNGLWGRMYFDKRGITSGNYALGDEWLGNAAAVAEQLGFDPVVDDQPATFGRLYPMSRIALYAGWYDPAVSGPFTLPEVDFMPGAIAYHLHSFSAAKVRSATEHWVGPLLEKGATATVGFVHEPYLAGTMDLGVFTSRFIYYGFSLGEAAWASTSALSWQMTVIGDPLYRPFRLKPQELHERLVAQESDLVEWSHLRVVNLNLAVGGNPNELLLYLDQIPETDTSAVLLEKQAELYEAVGKPNTAVVMHRRALEHSTVRQQRIRLSLSLVERLLAMERSEEAGTLLDQIAGEFPEYQEQVVNYRQMLELADQLRAESRSDGEASNEANPQVP